MLGSLRRLLLRIQGPIGARRPLRLLVLVVGLFAIVSWQRSFLNQDVQLDKNWTITASRGVQQEPKFYFFLYHLGLYPLCTLTPLQADTREEAERHLRENPRELRMDQGLTFRSGDRGRTYLYFVSTWLNGSAVEASLIPAAHLGFTFALCAIFAVFWFLERTLFGSALVLFLGSNPFQLFEIYRRENVFSWTITSALLLFALHVPLMVRAPRKPLYYIVPIVAGLWLATIRTVRSEGTAMALGVLVVYVFAERTRWREKAAMIALFLFTFAGVGRLYNRHFLEKFEQTQAALQNAGGVPFDGPIVLYHEVWPAVWGGLGDFDATYGYQWEDRTTYAYALPIMKEKYGVQVPDWDPSKWHFEPRTEYEKMYPFFFFEAPHYEDVLKAKVFTDVRRDPGWYVDIVKKRVWRIFTEATPVSITTTEFQLETGAGILALGCVPLLIFLVASRRWMFAKMLVFLTPLSLTPLIIYSGGGTPNYNCFHIVGAVILLSLALEGARRSFHARFGGHA